MVDTFLKFTPQQLEFTQQEVAHNHGRLKGVQGAWSPDFEIWHFSIAFLAKKAVFLVSRGKNEMHTIFGHPWKNIFGYLWKNALLSHNHLIDTNGAFVPLKKILSTPMPAMLQNWQTKIVFEKNIWLYLFCIEF